MRLIDANALLEKMQFSREVTDAYLEAVRHCVLIGRSLVKNAPTVDAVEVVRCKDCKYGEPSINAIGEPSIACNNSDVGFYEWLLEEDDFCSYGERKDND